MDAGLQKLVHHLCRLVTPPDTVLDAVLLSRFTERRDEGAFAALVARHGPMVLRTCQRVLANAAAAEDCFQATFLVLARKAVSLRRPESLAGWLHGVALNVAAKARKAGHRRRFRQMHARARELPDPHPDPLTQLTVRELLVAVDEEVQRLAEVYRLPVILCCLENLSNEEAARRLGWTVGSVKARLERGRKRLQTRLAKRGLGLPTALVALAVARGAASAGVGPGLRVATTKVALTFAAGLPASGASAPCTAITLAEVALHSMALIKLKALGLMAVILAVAIAGTGRVVWSVAGEKSATIGAHGLHKRVVDPVAVQPTSAPKPGPRLDKSGDPLPPGALARLGTTRFRLGNYVSGMALSPDGKTAISVGGNSRTQFWDVATGKVIRSIDSKQGGGGHAIAYSPDGKLAASIKDTVADAPHDDQPRMPTFGKHGLLQLWDAATGKQLAKVRLNMNDTRCLAFAPDGVTLAAGGLSAKLGGKQDSYSTSVVSLSKWNGKTLVPLWEARPDNEAPIGSRIQGIKSLAFSADGKLLATGGQANNIIRIWNVSQGKVLSQMKASGTQVSALAFAPNEARMASGGDDGEVVLWEPTTGVKKWQSKLRGEVRALAFSTDGKSMAASGGSQSGWRREQLNEPFLVLLDPKSGREIRRISTVRECVVSVAFSKDCKILAAALGGTIRVWDADTGRELSFASGHDSGISSVAVSDDGKNAATAGDNGEIVLWDLASGMEKRRLPGHQASVQAAGFVPGGKLLASASTDQTVRLWDVAKGDEVRRLEGIPEGSMDFMAISLDGKTLASGNNFNGIVHVWNVATGQRLHTLNLGGKRGRGVMCLAFSPDSKILAGGERMLSVGVRGKNAWIQLWDAKTGRRLREFPAYEYAVASLAFAPDGNTLASTGWDGKTISLSDVESGKSLFELPCDSNNGVVAFSPDGKTLAWSGLSVEVCLWETASKKLRRKFSGHSSFVHSLAFLPDGKALISGSRDTTAIVWDLTGLKSDPTSSPSLSSERLLSLWKALANTDAEQAGRALWTLTADPKRSIPFIEERLRELPRADRQRIPQLIADLDNPTFKVREDAEKKLEVLGKLAVSSLREAYANRPSLETSRRIEKLLAKREAPIQSPEVLQTLRALEVLEHVGGPEGRKALESFVALQKSEVYFEQEAKASVKRMRKR